MSSGGGGGGGGLGAGGDVFVQQGATLIIEGGSTLNTGAATGGAGDAASAAGAAYGSDIFIQGTGTLELAAAAGQTTAVAGQISDQTGSNPNDPSGSEGAGGVVIGDTSGTQTGTVHLLTANTYTGGTTIESGVLELGDSGAAGSEHIAFVAIASLELDAGVTRPIRSPACRTKTASSCRASRSLATAWAPTTS